jgi:glutathione S-transferase
LSLKLIGANISPFVRKVRVVLAEKGLSYDHDPMIPVGVSDEYRRLHPQEFADAGLINGTIVLFQERLLGPVFFKRDGDEAKVKEALETTIPPLFDYLERELGDSDWLVGNRYGIADLAVGSQFVNFAHGKGEVDAGRWPKLAAYVERLHTRPSFKAIIEEEKAQIQAMSG